MQTPKFLFTSDSKGTIAVWNIKQQKLLKRFETYKLNKITSIAASTNNKSQFTGNQKGYLYGFSIQKNFKPLTEYGAKILFEIRCLKITPNNQYLFASCYGGLLKKWDITKHELVKDFGKIHDYPINTMAISNDSKFLYTAGSNGCIHQFDIETNSLQKVIKGCIQKTNGRIYSMAITSDNKHLFTSDQNGFLMQQEVQQDQYNLKKDYGKIHDNCIYSIAVSKDGKCLFTSSYGGYLKQWGFSCEENSVEEKNNHGKVTWGDINEIVCTDDSRYLFTSDDRGFVKQWDVKSSQLVKNYGKIHMNHIYSITLS